MDSLAFIKFSCSEQAVSEPRVAAADPELPKDSEQVPEAEAVPEPAAQSEPEPASPLKPSSTMAQDLTAEEAASVLAEQIVDKLFGEVPDEDQVGFLVTPKVVTAPFDPRFPNTNQARHCFIRYNEFYKCVYERSEEDERCQFYKRAYESVCPSDWLEEWQTLREQGLWFGKY